MTKNLLLGSMLAFGFMAKSQNCTFYNSSTDSLDNYLAVRGNVWGSMPDTNDNLPLATMNQLYSTTLEIKWASSTRQLDPNAPADVPVNGIKITNITGLPPGLTFTSPASTSDDVYCDGQGTNAQVCDWPGGSYACIKLEGTPTAVGTYPITVDLQVSYFGGPGNGPYNGLVIVVQPVGIDEFDINPFKVKQNVPNPFSDVTNISYSVKKATNAQFFVMNLLGEVVYSKNMKAKEGDNTISFDGSDLNEGIYMYTIEINGKKVTKRMIIK